MDKVIGNYTSQENRSFPLDCETLESIQNNIDMLGALGNMAGDKTILSGCQEQEGGGRTEGYVFLKTTAYPMGEVLHFAASTVDSDYLHIVTTNGNVTQGGVTYSGAYTTRQIAQGTGTEQWAWAELTEPVDIEAIAAELRQQMSDIQTEMSKIKQEPLGVVEMFSGSTIPENYGVCNGQELSQEIYRDLYQVIGTRFNKDGTAAGNFCLPDLSGRFIVGYGSGDYNTVGNTGGEEKVQLTAEESGVGSHTHTARVSGGEHTHPISGTSSWEDDGNNGHAIETGSDNSGETHSCTFDATATGGAHEHTVTIEAASAEAEKAHENRPPYFVLFYIMRLK